MKTEVAETIYKDIVIIHLLGGNGFQIKDIVKTTLITRTGNQVYQYKHPYADFFREAKRYNVINHRYIKTFSTLKSAKEAINAYWELKRNLELATNLELNNG